MEAVRLWAEDAIADGEELPPPRLAETLRADPEVAQALGTVRRSRSCLCCSQLTSDPQPLRTPGMEARYDATAVAR
jgi:hypothetical protein